MYLLVQKCPRPQFHRVYPLQFYKSEKRAQCDARRMTKEFKGTSKFEVWEVEVKQVCQENHF